MHCIQLSLLMSQSLSATFLTRSKTVCNTNSETSSAFNTRWILWFHNPVKSASTKQSMSREYGSEKVSPYLKDYFKYWPIHSRAISWLIRVPCTNLATWLTANVTWSLECEWRFVTSLPRLSNCRLHMLLLIHCLLPKAQWKMVCLLVGDFFFAMCRLFL